MSKRSFKEMTRRPYFWIFATMAFSGMLSLVASLVLSIEAFELLKNPDAVLSCSVNAVINCASVMKHSSAELLGFPNSFLGLIAEPIVITVGLAGMAGVKFPKPFMALAQIGYGLGLIFAYYLFFVSAYVIEALCPWCLLVTLSTTLVFSSLLNYNIRENNLYLPKGVNDSLKSWVAKGYGKFTVALLLAAVVFLILFKYQSALFG